MIQSDRSDNSIRNLSLIKTVRTLTVHNGTVTRDRAKVAVENPLTIVLNSEEIVTLLCIPDAPILLALGFLFSEGLVDSIGAIHSVDADAGIVRITADEGHARTGKLSKRVVTTGCGKGTTFFFDAPERFPTPLASNVKIYSKTIVDLMKQLLSRSHLHRETRGVHNTALASEAGIEIFHTDVGRHNAVDKIYGQSIVEERTVRDKILLTTGRISSEIVIKCVRMGIPILVSRHAATSLAVELACQLNMTLVGYVRGSRFTVYTGFERIRDYEGRRRL
jgi:FdhD protein